MKLSRIREVPLASRALAVLFACLVPAPSALATHGGSHDPSPSGPDCKWYGSAGHEAQFSADENGNTNFIHEKGSGWSGPSDDSTCRGTVQFSYTRHDTYPDGQWSHSEGEHTVSSTYEAGWANFGPPGTFTASFPGDEPVTLVTTDSSGGEPVPYEAPGGSSAGCVVPGADTPAKRAKIQAVVITCSQIEAGSADQTWTGTIRMRRAQCDRSIDTDGDDLADCTEFSLQTEPQNPDTDGDALTDGEEVLTHGTDPRDPDSDDGGVEDGDELALGIDPLDPADDGEIDCNDGISNDFDGLTDHPSDPGCTSSADQSELGNVECDNGTDDDGDGTVDWPADQHCLDATGESELSACGTNEDANRVFTRLDGIASLDLGGAPDPDFGTFNLGVRWWACEDGPLIEQASSTASLSGNWVFLGALEFFGLEPYHTPGTASINGDEAFGRARFGVDVSPAELLSNFLPASKLIKVLDKARDRLKIDKVRLGNADALKKFHATVKNKLDDFEGKFENALADKLASSPGVSDALADGFAGLVTAAVKVATKTLGKLLDRVPAKELFKRVFGKIKVKLWDVEAGIRVHSDGSYEFLDNSSSPLLKDEWTETSTGR